MSCVSHIIVFSTVGARYFACIVSLNNKLAIINDNLKASHVQMCNSHTAQFKVMVINYRKTYEIQIFTQTDHFPIYVAVIFLTHTLMWNIIF